MGPPGNQSTSNAIIIIPTNPEKKKKKTYLEEDGKFIDQVVDELIIGDFRQNVVDGGLRERLLAIGSQAQ